MTRRERVLRAYGHDPITCAWCASAQGPWEIDHIAGNGNTHRRRIGIKLHTWLWRHYTQSGEWPQGFQILCKPCHDRKSDRMAKDDSPTAQFNLRIPRDLIAQITALSETYEGGKNALVQDALRAHISHTFAQSAMETFRNDLSTVHTDVLRYLDGLKDQITTLAQRLHTVDQHVHALEDSDNKRYAALLQAFDRLKPGPDTEKKRASFFQRT